MARRRSRARRYVPDGPFEAHVEDLAHDARGVARVEGKVAFISDALPGEDVLYMRHRRRSGFDEGELHEVVKASPQRVEPGCRHFGVCGGCSLQHLAPAAQIEFKQSQLLDNLSRIGGVEPDEIAPPLTGPVWGYRRRARLGVKHVPAKGRVLVGFRERGNPYIAVLEGCEILEPSVGRRLVKLGEVIGSLSICDRLPQIEAAVADNGVALVLRILDSPSREDIARLQAFAQRESVWFYLQPGGLDSVRPLDADTPALYYRLERYDITLYFEPTDFIQVNGPLNVSMVDQAISWLSVEPEDHVLELFSGLGNFSMPMARQCSRVTAVEGDAMLVARAVENARRNGIDNLDCHAADLFADPGTQDPSTQGWAGQSVSKALLDPPRAGAQEVLPMIGKSGVQQLVYVSCHAATLARDTGILCTKHGFRLQRAGVMDMFPHTSHVESMALLVRD